MKIYIHMGQDLGKDNANYQVGQGLSLGLNLDVYTDFIIPKEVRTWAFNM